jgi:ribosomal protein S18 acetylase RimI-like enzyme
MNPASICLRPTKDTDRELLFRIYASTREEEMAQVPWPVAQRQAFLEMQFNIQDQQYRGNYENADFQIIVSDGEDAGRLYTQRTATELRIIDIALLPEFRGRGIGGLLLGQLVQESEASSIPIRIHVERNSRALRLYERTGFRVIEDKGVYLFLERAPDGSSRPP